ncbi:MAG: DUF4397 domain-containing protein [Ardenticatenales bacterium]|nr:DUF4397 domain-containing protein [Ardenticatenales bacterium]
MRALRWLVAVILIFQTGSSVWAQTLDPARQPSAQLRFVHALPGGGAVDIYHNGTKIVSALPASEATEYGIIATGAQMISIRAAGADPSATPLLEQSLTLNTGLSYTLVVAPDKNNAPAMMLLEDDTSADAQGRGSLRLVNLAQGNPAISAVADEAAVTGLLAYGESSARVPVGKGTPVITIIDAQGKKLLSTPPIPLQSGNLFYTLFVIGAGSTLDAIIVSYPTSSGQVPNIRQWLPMVPGGDASSNSTTVTGAAPAGVPVTGSAAMPSSASLWFMALGMLLMAGVVGFQWWRGRQV